MKAILILGVFVVLLAVAATGCEDAEPDVTARLPVSTSTPAELGQEVDATESGDGTWTLELLDGRPLIEESVITLRIDGNIFDGFSGCNRYGWRTEEGMPTAGAEGTFKISGFYGTDEGCVKPEGILEQEDLYESALLEAERYRVEGDRLEIIGGKGRVRLVFKRDAPPAGRPIDLEGTAWQLITEGDVGAPTMAFLNDRLSTGVTACRPYAAIYRLSGVSVRFPSTSMLRYDQSCSEESWLLEGEFTDFLTWAREYSVYEEEGLSHLEIRSARGRTLTFRPLPPAVEDIADAEWTLRTFIELRQGGGVPMHSPVVEGTEVTISFGEDGISGSSGCNFYLAPASVEDELVTIDTLPLNLTGKTCEDIHGLREQEDRYFGLLPRLTRYGIYGDSLFMQTNDDVFLLFQASLEARNRELQMPRGADSPSSTATPTPGPMPTAERNLLERPPKGPGVELGKHYRYSLYVHCGIRDAYFDGRQWMANPMLSDGSGNPPPGWTYDDSRGTMVLAKDDLAIFTAVSGREIMFVPWPSDVEWRPCF